MALAHQLDAGAGGAAGGLARAEALLALVADADPDRYVRAFDRLATWVADSLDMYRVRTVSPPSRLSGWLVVLGSS